MRRMTIVIEVAAGPAPAGAATAGCHTACHEETDRRRGNERRGSGQTAARSPTGARPYGFRSFRDRRVATSTHVLSAAEPGSCRTFRSGSPMDDQLLVRIAAAYGDGGDGDDAESSIVHQIDLSL